MGKKGKKAQAGKPKKLTPKDVGKRMDTLVKKLEENPLTRSARWAYGVELHATWSRTNAARTTSSGNCRDRAAAQSDKEVSPITVAVGGRKIVRALSVARR